MTSSNWWEKKHRDIKNIKKDEKKIISKITNLTMFLFSYLMMIFVLC